MKKKIKRNLTILWYMIAVILIVEKYSIVLAAAPTAKPVENSPRVVRVGYYILDGLQEYNGSNRSGYNYEYLEKLAKYANWTYEYVDCTWDEGLRLLREGEIDLLGAATKNVSRTFQFSFPYYESGVSYAEIYERAENGTLSSSSVVDLNRRRMGLLIGSSRNEDYYEFCRENKISTHNIFYESLEALSAALENGEVDAIATDFYLPQDGERLIVRFSAAPFYFMTNKNSPALMGELNNALHQLKLSDPSFNSRLYEKYFGATVRESASLNTLLYRYRVPLFIALLGVALLVNMGIIFSKRKNERRLWRIAYIDRLTELPNWDKLKEDLTRIPQDHKNSYAYVNFDINQFKFLNDTLGYETGDRILQSLAEAIRSFLQEGELAGRVSRDIFSLYLHYESDEALTQRLLTFFNQFSKTNAQDVASATYRISLSCGVCRGQDCVGSIDFINDNANIARRSVKDRHETAVAFYSPEARNDLLLEKELEDDMQAALDGRQFLIYFQPKFNLLTGSLAGAEALVRWNHPRKGLLPPSQFIPTFEKNGFIVKLDLYVLKETCREIRHWLDKGLTVQPISVNLSRADFNSRNCIKTLKEIVKEFHIPSGLIEFELTESVINENIDQVIYLMYTLREAGFLLSMDDFGTGYSSLSLLKEIPIHTLKLDKGFLNDCLISARGKSILCDIIALARHIKITVLCEGVETAEQAEFLKKIGCEIVQGFYFATPMPAPFYEPWLHGDAPVPVGAAENV